MSWHFLQEQEAASWEGTSLDGAPAALLKLMPTPEECSLLANGTECSRPFRSGTTCAPSTGASGRTRLTLCPAGSPAKTLALPEAEKDSTANAPAFGWKWHGSLAKYDLATHTWRTRQPSLLGDLDEFSETWPQWGSMLDGELLEQTTPMLHTRERDSGFWPTLTASIGKKCGGRHRGKADTLASRIAEVEGLSTSSTGRVNPEWGEWLMGVPIGWTDCGVLAMDRFREWQRLHGGF